jgi:hypothetical protein
LIHGLLSSLKLHALALSQSLLTLLDTLGVLLCVASVSRTQSAENVTEIDSH